MTFQVVGGNLLPEAVTWFFTSVLRGLQVHGQHEVCHTTLSLLAMLIYENLVRLMAIVTAIICSLFLRLFGPRSHLGLQLTIILFSRLIFPLFF